MNEENKIIIYNSIDGKASVSLFAKDGSVWMNQNQLAELFDTSKQNISLHIINILKEKELQQNSVVKDYLTTASDGKNYFNKKRKEFDAKEADKEDLKEIEELEKKLKNDRK